MRDDQYMCKKCPRREDYGVWSVKIASFILCNQGMGMLELNKEDILIKDNNKRNR